MRRRRLRASMRGDGAASSRGRRRGGGTEAGEADLAVLALQTGDERRLPFGVVAAPHQRTALDVEDAAGDRELAKLGELVGVHVSGDLEVLAAGLQVLAE